MCSRSAVNRSQNCVVCALIDGGQGRNYLLCDYNRDGDSHRSPWSNHYDPPLEDGFLPSDKLRAMEVQFNELFDAYRELYFDGGTSSVYLWDLDQGFAGCFLILKSKWRIS
jgi:capping protein (actin filament) muscle Z-line, beta